MSNLVIVAGDYSSGTTLLFTLFRETGEYYCLYEPLNDRLPEYLIWPSRVYEHHFFVENYYAEYQGFREIPNLFDPSWAMSRLYLPPDAEADALYRYLCYLIGTAFGRGEKVMLKENCVVFRLGWIRSKFPHAKIIHIYRDKTAQWNSIVRRAQAHVGREDVGQADVMFEGMHIAAWCQDLQTVFPALDAKNFQSGYDRFCKLWELSKAEQERYADLSVDYWTLTHDFEATCKRVFDCVGCTADIESLKQFVVPPEQQKELRIHPSGLSSLRRLLDRAMRKYARARLAAHTYWRHRAIR